MNKFLKTKYGKIRVNELKIKKIPNTPKMRLPNYLNSLYDQEIDEKTNPILLITTPGSKISTEKLKNYSRSYLNYLFNHTKYFRVVGSNHNIRLPRILDPRLSYLIGYLYGDGGLKDIRRSYKIW